MVPKHKYKGKHPLQLAFKLQWTLRANPSDSRDYLKQSIAGWEEFQPKCLIEFISKKEAKWGRGSCSACIEQFWQSPVCAALVLLCFGAGTSRLAGGYTCTLHALCHLSANPPKFGLVRSLLGWDGRERREQESLLTSHKLWSVREQQAGHPETRTLNNCSLEGIDVCTGYSYARWWSHCLQAVPEHSNNLLYFQWACSCKSSLTYYFRWH